MQAFFGGAVAGAGGLINAVFDAVLDVVLKFLT
jgi:hypothetical protein